MLEVRSAGSVEPKPASVLTWLGESALSCCAEVHVPAVEVVQIYCRSRDQCAPIACSEQLLPQLVAQIASLDGDHGVSFHANDDCVDLILTHKDHASPQNDEGPGLMLSASEAAHVVHIATGSTTPKQSPLLVVSNTPDVVPFFDNRCFSVADICSAPKVSLTRVRRQTRHRSAL